MLSFIYEFWPHIVGVLTTLLSLITSANAVLHKRETQTAIGWVGLIWLAPILGSVLYLLLGINRIQRRATELRQSWPQLQPTAALLPSGFVISQISPTSAPRLMMYLRIAIDSSSRWAILSMR